MNSRRNERSPSGGVSGSNEQTEKGDTRPGTTTPGVVYSPTTVGMEVIGGDLFCETNATGGEIYASRGYGGVDKSCGYNATWEMLSHLWEEMEEEINSFVQVVNLMVP